MKHEELRWNAHDALVALLKECLKALRDESVSYRHDSSACPYVDPEACLACRISDTLKGLGEIP